MRLLALAVGLALSASIAANEPGKGSEAAEWRKVNETTGQLRDVASLEQLAGDFPDSSNVRLRLLQSYLEGAETKKAIETLRWLKERGYVFGDVSRTQIPKLIGEAHAEEARALLIPAADVIASSEIVATIPAEAGLIESVFSPGIENMFIATSVTEQALYLSDPEGKWQRFDIPEANDLTGIVSDASRDIGWVASANIDQSTSDKPQFTGLIGLRDGLSEILKIPAPEGVAISDLAVSTDGRVFASDPLGGGVYSAKSDTERLETFISPGTFRSPQGLATSADGKMLYVSDYRYGIAVVDLLTREVSRLKTDLPIALDGIDGLWLYGKHLVAVQNGISPMKIVAMTLSDDGARVTDQRVLEQANPEWTEPLSGNIDGERLLYIGNGQWDRYVNGQLGQGKEAIPTQIRALNLGNLAESTHERAAFCATATESDHRPLARPCAGD